jgi:L-lactate dehydrogenase complex protein LldG
VSDARSRILAALGAALIKHRGGAAPAGQASIAAAAEGLRVRAAATRPERLAGGPVNALMNRLVSPALAATVERVATLADFPAAVRRYLSARGLASSVALQPHPELLALGWPELETHAQLGIDEPVAVGLALGAIAETGTLVFHSGPSSPTLFAFLPVHHIVAVRADRIWSWLEDYTAAFAGGTQPRNVNLITGASGTTDIEGILVRGAHGPGYLHVVLVGQEHPSAR